MEVQPRDLSTKDRYKLLVGAIVPRPIAFVSTISVDGCTNLAPFSFFNGVGSNPLTLVFCPGNRPDGSDKDTLRNCKPVSEGGTGEFIVNAAIEEYKHQLAAAAEPLPPDESEFDLTALEAAPSRVVAPPRVAASPVAFECRTIQVIRTNPGAAGGGNLVLGEVVHLFIDDDLLDEKMRINQDRLQAIGRLGGPSYCSTRERFDMPRGRDALRDRS